jgi:hypothetical protein
LAVRAAPLEDLHHLLPLYLVLNHHLLLYLLVLNHHLLLYRPRGRQQSLQEFLERNQASLPILNLPLLCQLVPHPP